MTTGNMSSSDAAQWLSKIQQVQSAKSTPEQRARVKERAEHISKIAEHSKKAARLQKCSDLSPSIWSGQMRSMQQIASAPAAAYSPAFSRAQEMERVSAQTTEQYTSLQRVLREDSAEADLELNRLEMEVGAVQALGGAEGTADATMDELLQELRVEPAEAAEVAAKFSLFEKFLETVVEIRNELFAFWAGARSDFPDGACHTVEADMKAIDREENTGLADEDRHWFVHGMTVKASANHKMISRTLAQIKTRLDLLGRQEDCPVCFELFSSEREPVTLGCCHKVCQECWTHWTAMRRGAAFCPLCRHDEFLGAVLIDTPM